MNSTFGLTMFEKENISHPRKDSGALRSDEVLRLNAESYKKVRNYGVNISKGYLIKQIN